jgi:AcrR family transcriptional regulator
LFRGVESEADSVPERSSSGIACRTNHAHLFGIVSHDEEKRPDARTARTYRALSVALVDLMRTKEFDAITVQDLLDRAGVGRATFYSHFRNKDDFLLTDLERMLAALEAHFDRTSARTKRVAPLAELLEHLHEARGFAEALERSGRMEAVLDISSGHLSRIIERRLKALDAHSDLPLTAAARVFGAMAMELSQWWLSRETSLSARDMDDRFHELVWRGLSGPAMTKRT